MANPVLLRMAVRVFHSHSTPLQSGQGCWQHSRMALLCCEHCGDGDALRQPRTQTDVTDGSTIKWASLLGPPGIQRDIKWLSEACKLSPTDDKLIVLCGQLTADATMLARGL